MNIRPGVPQDADSISALLTGLAEKFITVSLNAEGKANLLDSMTTDAIAGFFAAGYRYHVAVDQGEIVGVVATRDNVHLFHLFVAEAIQGKGLFSELWRVAKAACLAAGNPGYFTVNSSLNAQAVYLGWGFKPIAGIREGGGVRDVPMKMTL